MTTARTFDSIIIIFNPNSTGDAPKLAEELRTRLGELLPYAADIRLQPTDHAGHAVELARDAASGGRDVLVVSVSGDGGYNEVVNGVMQAGNPNAVCAVMAAGNANDHRRATGTRPLEHAIAGGTVRHIDLLRIRTGHGHDAPAKYAHSYIGFGLTPVMAIDLENGSKFEVITFPHRPKWRILLTALKATTQGLGHQPSVSSYRFTTLKPIPYQIDGEVKSVESKMPVIIDCAPAALATLG